MSSTQSPPFLWVTLVGEAKRILSPKKDVSMEIFVRHIIQSISANRTLPGGNVKRRFSEDLNGAIAKKEGT